MKLSTFIFIAVFVCCSCHQTALKKNEFNEFIGKDFNLLKKNKLEIMKDMCSPYSFFRINSQTDSTTIYLFMSKKCNDAAYEIIVNRKSNKIIKITDKNMA